MGIEHRSSTTPLLTERGTNQSPMHVTLPTDHPIRNAILSNQQRDVLASRLSGLPSKNVSKKIEGKISSAKKQITDTFGLPKDYFDPKKHSVDHVKHAKFNLLKKIDELRDGTKLGEWVTRNYLSDVAEGTHGKHQKDALLNIFKREIKRAYRQNRIAYVENERIHVLSAHLQIGARRGENTPLINLALRRPVHMPVHGTGRIDGATPFDAAGGRISEGRHAHNMEFRLAEIAVVGDLGSMAREALMETRAANPEIDRTIDEILRMRSELRSSE